MLHARACSRAFSVSVFAISGIAFFGCVSAPTSDPVTSSQAALTASTISITPSAQTTLWLDANKCNAQGPRGAWLSYIIKNTGASALTNVTVSFAGFTGANAAYFDSPADLTRTFSNLAAGAEEPVYYYVDYSEVCNHPLGGGSPFTGYTANYTVSAIASGFTSVVYNGTVTTGDLLTTSAAGQATLITLSPGVYVGQLLKQTVKYAFGNNSDLFFQPAGEAGFDNACIRLVQSEITGLTGSFTGIAVGNNNRLWFPSASSNATNNFIDVTFTWEIRCVNRAQDLNPWAAAKSGQKYKYTGFSAATIFPAAQPVVTASKSVFPTSLLDNTGGPVTWTIIFSNSSLVSVRLAKITDVVPACMSINNPSAAGSDVTATNSASIPAVGATGTVTWTGRDLGDSPSSTYQVPAGGSLVLKYTTNISGCPFPATYTNSATGTVGTTTVGPVTATIRLGSNPQISITKTSNATGLEVPGQSITYSYLVANTGNVPLSSVTVTDNRIPGPITCPSTTLNVSTTMTCTASYVVTSADVSAGKIINTATATGQPPTGNPVSATDTLTVLLTGVPKISLAKSASPVTYTAPGQTITYTYTITNTGFVSLPGPFSVVDNVLGTLSNCASGPLAVGASTTCTAPYSVTQADMDAGRIVNTAVASTTYAGQSVDTNQATATVTTTRRPHLTLTKVASRQTFSKAGEVITYTLTAVNDGNVTLSLVSITDTLLSTLSCTPAQPATLAPGANLSCTGTYVTTAADVSAGRVFNEATATGKDPTNTSISATDQATVGKIALTLTKTATPVTYNAVGQIITYTYGVTNTGTTTLAGPFAVTDNLLGTIAACGGSGSLAPGATKTCTKTYTVTQADLDAGSITNVASVSANGATSDEVTAIVNAQMSPLLSLTKSASPQQFTRAGQVITYTLVAKNMGNVTLSGVRITDTRLASLTCTPAQPTTLAPNATLTCTGTYTTTVGDLSAGHVYNTATATGTDPTGTAISATATAAVAPLALTLVKVANPMTYGLVGQLITYTYTITNTGAGTLPGPFSVEDDKLGAFSCGNGPLAPGASTSCTATYVITQADIDVGRVSNSAFATANDVTSAPVTATVSAIQTPAISLTKSASPTTYSGMGQTLTYTYTVTNSGNVTLPGPFSVSDDKLGNIPCGSGPLMPGETRTCTATYVTTQADLALVSIVNVATATSTYGGSPITSNQATTTVPKVVSVIDAINDSGDSVVGATGGVSFTNVLVNDTLGGVAVDPTKVTTSFVSSTNSGVTLSGTNNVLVAAGTPAGDYTLTYRICEIANPTNCDTAVVTVPVTAAAIDAVNDTGASVSGATGGTSFTNVLGNDKLNGAAVNPTKVTTTFVSSTNSGVTLSGTNVVVAPGTAAGDYTLTYKICEILNPTNCDTAVVTVPVTAPAIDAVNDSGTSVNGANGGTSFTNVLVNDTLNGAAVNPTKVTTTFVSSTNSGVTLSGTNVVVAAGTPAGDYTLTYKICEILNPTNCDAAVVTVPVSAPVIDAVNDSGTSVNGANGGTSFANVLGNDTLNGAPVDPTKVTTTFVSSTNSGVTLSGTNVVVAAGTPAGSYTLTYQICEILNSTNCDTAVVTVPVSASAINAVNDSGTSLNGATGGTSFTNVLVNDTLNGALVDPAKVTTTFVSSTNSGVTLSGTNVVVAAGTPAGSQSLTYKICEKLNPTNCDTAVVSVPVTAPVIDAVNDPGAPVNGVAGGVSFVNVLGNDALNGAPVDPTKVTLTFVSSTSPAVTLAGTNVVVAPGTPAGGYTLTYQICEKVNPTNCDTAVVSVPVTASPIDAVNDTGTPVNGAAGGTSMTNVLANDTLNGVAVDPALVTTTFVSSSDPGVTLSGTNVVVAAGTPAGSQTLTYQICEKLNPTNCDTAVVSVPVTAPLIDAVNDSGTAVNGASGGTSFTNVLANDTLNGVAVNPALVNTTFVSSSNPGVTLSGTNVLVAAGTPAGSQTLTYQICEKLNPTNCDTAVVTVPVNPPVIDAVNDTGASVKGTTGGTSFTNVLVNDKLNGVAVDPTKVTTTFVSSTNPGVTLSGTNVVVAPGTAEGSYTLTYQICEKANPTNCDTAVVTVPVTAPVACVAGSYTFTGNDAVSGFPGLTKTYAVNGINVRVSAWARSKILGNYYAAYLGAYSDGLGVTDITENGSSNTHTDDNNGTENNYLLFEFDQRVVSDQVYLGLVNTDSDLSVWFGDAPGGVNPYWRHQSLDATMLSGLTTETNLGANAVRWANINATSKLGNVLVVAAKLGDSDDYVKVKNLKFGCPAALAVACPTTTGTVGQAYSSSVVASGGTGPYAYSLATGALPTGLTGPNSSTGAITGTPTAAAAYSFTAKAVDSVGAAVTKACTMTITPSCVAGTFAFTGSDANSGTAGNIKSYTINGVNVKVSAWRRNKTSGTYYTSYLGAYANGLGVTDSTEGTGANNTHAVDNNGTEDNYLLFEFDRRVISDQAYLGLVVTDSDVSAWYGDAPNGVNPYTTHQTLNASLLSGLTTETNLGTNAVRWANINATSKAGNLLVVASKIGEANDYVKVQNLKYGCP